MLIQLTSIFLVFAGVNAALAPLRTVAGPKAKGSYIVNLKASSLRSEYLAWVKSNVKHGLTLTHGQWSPAVNRGFAARLEPSALDILRQSPYVESIEEDGIVYAQAIQHNVTWGLARISHLGKLNQTEEFTFQYDDSLCIRTVDVYVLDTGVNIEHSDFEGRARLGPVFGSEQNVDGNGHGTYLAGVVGGRNYGVAKRSNIISVKILSDNGSGSWTNVISGIDAVLSAASASKNPSVIVLAIGGGPSITVDNAVIAAINAGIHVVVPAGGSNGDASNTSPARVIPAVTVGASGIDDCRTPFSSYGPVVDIFAPGWNIPSTWIGSTTATNTLSGSSVSVGFVAGAIAYLLCVEGPRDPPQMITRLHELAEHDVMCNIPSGTINELLKINNLP